MKLNIGKKNDKSSLSSNETKSSISTQNTASKTKLKVKSNVNTPTSEKEPQKEKKSEPSNETKIEPMKEKAEYGKVNTNQIIRFDGNGCFVEVLKGGFGLQKNNCVGKVHFNFVDYDSTSHSQKNLLRCYMDIDKWLAWEKQWTTGQWHQLIEDARQKQKAGKYQYCQDIKVGLGGGFENGELYSRQIKFTPGNKRYTIKNAPTKDLVGELMPEKYQPLVFSCEYAPGKTSETGLIVPKGKPVKVVRVPLMHEQVDALFAMVHIHIQAFYANTMNDIKIHEKNIEELMKINDELQKKIDEILKQLKNKN